MRSRISWVLGAVLGLAACSSPPAMMMMAPPDLLRVCGARENPGNSVGVGRGCESGNDCAATASLCVPLIGEGRSFCTALCDSASDARCGEGARCACAGGGCTCLPAECER